MASYQSFEDLNIWKESIDLSLKVYKEFSEVKDYGFRDQIQRSSVSIPSNIAEGFERQSDKEFVRFLYIAKGSCGELRTQLHLAIELKYLDPTYGEELMQKAKMISGMIQNLIKVKRTQGT